MGEDGQVQTLQLVPVSGYNMEEEDNEKIHPTCPSWIHQDQWTSYSLELMVFPQPDTVHMVPSAAHSVGRATGCTYSFRMAGVLSLISMMSLSML